MKSRNWLILLLIMMSMMFLATYAGVTNSAFLDTEDSSDDTLCTITNWYHLAWHWRKPITISNSGGALTDYQVKVSVNTQELISEGKMQSGGEDIRFTSSDGTTDIPYWIESGINTTSTVIWVKVPSIPSGDSTIYIYYSNSSASAATSVSATFSSGSFQDLFNDTSSLDAEASSGITLTSGEAQLIVSDTEVADVNQASGSASISAYDNQWIGQTFYANLTGFLTRVIVRTAATGNPPGYLEVQIRNAVGNEPGDTVYATAIRDDIGGTVGDYSFTFNIAAAVTAGTQYAVVVRTEGGDVDNSYLLHYQNADVYPGGRAQLSTNAGGSWTGYDVDLYLKTYITTAAELDRNQIASSANEEVYSDNWSAQSFIAGESGDLSMVVIEAYETGSAPNNLVVEIQDSEEYIEEVIDQSQTAYSADRQVYDVNWWAQTFRTGTSGDLSKITLRAAETGTPPGNLTVELRNVTTGTQENEDQSQTSYSGDRQVYGDNWQAQIFQAGLSDDLSKITLRAAQNGTPPNDLTVELRNVSGGSEENSDQTQTGYDSSYGMYDTNWLGQTFQAGTTGNLTKVTLGLLRTENEDQSQTSYSGDRQVYGDNWTSQIFQAGASGDLSKITIRAAQNGTPPNDLTVELRNVTSGSQENEDQSQTSSDADRQIYGDNWQAQIFQAGVSGDLTKITLKAAQNGTPPNDLTVELRNAVQDEVLDQSQTNQDSNYPLYANRWVGQTFQAGISGEITKVTLTLVKTGSPTDPLVVEIRDCTGGDLPGTIVYATASKNPGDISTAGQYEFTFSSPASVTAGTKYSIVIYTASGDASNCYPLYYQASNVYANGRACASVDSGSSWTGYAMDAYFQTYVTIDAYIPGGTVYATASRSDITTAGEYDFTYSSPYAVTSGAKYAIVIYTSGGDASNYYGVSYQNSNVYANGRECSSTNGGTDWTGSDATDIFFRTYVTVPAGLIPGGTVYASASRSDITTAGEYDFTYSSPYAVTSGTSYAIVIYTSGGDASNYYNVSYQNSNAYTNGRECSSTNGGTDWTGSDATDIFFRTWMGDIPDALEVQIRNCTMDDLPGTTVYATASKDTDDIGTSWATHDFTFSTPASVTAGVKYAIVIKTDGGDADNNYPVSYQNSDAYANGRACLSVDSGSSWVGYPLDCYFQTYVTVSAYTPGSTVYASASRSDITTAGEYDFVFASPYAVTSGAKYAVVIYTSAGDASNCYNISYHNSNVYTNGRECYSTDGGAGWTGSNSTDLFFRTYITVEVGDTPGSTVYASASRSDITTAGEYDFVFASPYSVTAETNYAIVIYTSGGDASNYYNIAYQDSNAYGLGKECASTESGSSWLPNSSADLFFKTYISSATGKYQPGGTVYASASRSYIGASSQSQVFFFSTPASITSGTRYTLVVKTSGGDASNCYNVAYQSTDVYASGDRSYSSNGGTDWTMTDHDLYFKTYVEFDQTVSASATLKSVAIPTDSGTRLAVGTQISWNDTEQVNSDIKYQLEYYTGSGWSLVPDSALAGNSSGFDGSPVDISSILTDYGQVRLTANLSSTYSTDVPSIQDWTITYYYREYTASEPTSGGIGDEE